MQEGPNRLGEAELTEITRQLQNKDVFKGRNPENVKIVVQYPKMKSTHECIGDSVGSDEFWDRRKYKLVLSQANCSPPLVQTNPKYKDSPVEVKENFFVQYANAAEKLKTFWTDLKRSSSNLWEGMKPILETTMELTKIKLKTAQSQLSSLYLDVDPPVPTECVPKSTPCHVVKKWQETVLSHQVQLLRQQINLQRENNSEEDLYQTLQQQYIVLQHQIVLQRHILEQTPRQMREGTPL